MRIPFLAPATAALAALALACTRAPAPPSAAPAPAGTALRVLVYNIHAGLDSAGGSNLDSVAALVRATGADLVLLQEVDSGVRRSGRVDQPAYLAERTGLHAVFGSTLDYQGGEYGIAVLSRWPARAHRLVPLAVDPPQERAEPRGVLHVEIAAPDGVLHVLNTHLDPSADDRWRRQEADSVAALARALAERGRPVLVGGDFNSTPESDVQRRVRDAGLRDLWAACGAGEGFTYPMTAPAKRIDYLYALDDAGCRRAEVLPSRASDHRAVLFELGMPRGRAATP